MHVVPSQIAPPAQLTLVAPQAPPTGGAELQTPVFGSQESRRSLQMELTAADVPHGSPWPGGAVHVPALTRGSGVTQAYGDTHVSAVVQAAPAGSSGLQTSCVNVVSVKPQPVPATHSASAAEQSPPA